MAIETYTGHQADLIMASSVFSEAGARSRVDNLTLTTSVLDSEERSLIFASEWYFKPEGRTTVEKRFVKYLKKEGLVSKPPSFSSDLFSTKDNRISKAKLFCFQDLLTDSPANSSFLNLTKVRMLTLHS